VVSDPASVFGATSDGPVNAFINPAGYLHEIVTVRAVEAVELEGVPTQADSWFEGYAWTIVRCRVCQAHLGWQFDSLAPATLMVFWGLRRASIYEG